MKKQCPRCKEYSAVELTKETWKYYYFECKFCNFKKKRKVQYADYLMKGGKVYLKTDEWKEYKEVELITWFEKGRKYLKVAEVGPETIKLI